MSIRVTTAVFKRQYLTRWRRWNAVHRTNWCWLLLTEGEKRGNQGGARGNQERRKRNRALMRNWGRMRGNRDCMRNQGRAKQNRDRTTNQGDRKGRPYNIRGWWGMSGWRL